MRLHTIKALLAACAFVWSITYTYGQDNAGAKIVSGYVNLNDSVNVYRALYDNTPIEPEFKLVPKFAIIGAENRFVFSVGASMKFTTSFDWGNPVRNPLGMGPTDIKDPLTSGSHLLQMAAGGSGIFFNIIGFPNTDNEVGLFISLGLDSESDNTYKISAGQVYMRYRDFQCGYATSLYNDRSADAYTIDAHGPCASGTNTTVGVNWQHYFNNHIRLGFGMELPKASFTQIRPEKLAESQIELPYDLTSNQLMPNFPLYVGYNWGTGHIRLSAIIRNIHYTDLLTGAGRNRMGNGMKLTGHATLGPVNLFWMGQLGWGSASSFQDNKDCGLDLVPEQENPGLLRPTHCWGYIAGAQWNLTQKCFITCQQSYLRNYIPYYTLPAVTAFAEQMRYGITAVTNFIWKLSPVFSTGVEYRFAAKHNEKGETLCNNRVYAMLLMNF